MEWRTDGACFGTFNTAFFADGPESSQLQNERARRICYGCPVQVECLASGVDKGAKIGVWGGLTESQRKRYLAPAMRKHKVARHEVWDALPLLTQVINECGGNLVIVTERVAVAV